MADKRASVGSGGNLWGFEPLQKSLSLLEQAKLNNLRMRRMSVGSADGDHPASSADQEAEQAHGVLQEPEEAPASGRQSRRQQMNSADKKPEEGGGSRSRSRSNSRTRSSADKHVARMRALQDSKLKQNKDHVTARLQQIARDREMEKQKDKATASAAAAAADEEEQEAASGARRGGPVSRSSSTQSASSAAAQRGRPRQQPQAAASSNSRVAAGRAAQAPATGAAAAKNARHVRSKSQGRIAPSNSITSNASLANAAGRDNDSSAPVAVPMRNGGPRRSDTSSSNLNEPSAAQGQPASPKQQPTATNGPNAHPAARATAAAILANLPSRQAPRGAVEIEDGSDDEDALPRRKAPVPRFNEADGILQQTGDGADDGGDGNEPPELPPDEPTEDDDEATVPAATSSHQHGSDAGAPRPFSPSERSNISNSNSNGNSSSSRLQSKSKAQARADDYGDIEKELRELQQQIDNTRGRERVSAEQFAEQKQQDDAVLASLKEAQAEARAQREREKHLADERAKARNALRDAWKALDVIDPSRREQTERQLEDMRTQGTPQQQHDRAMQMESLKAAQKALEVLPPTKH